jgi:hypothetical protein
LKKSTRPHKTKYNALGLIDEERVGEIDNHRAERGGYWQHAISFLGLDQNREERAERGGYWQHAISFLGLDQNREERAEARLEM